MVDGSKKGRNAEREVAKMCHEWWSKVDRKCEFKRTPLSGGWSTETVREHFKAAGDIMTTSDKWPFTIEVKRREGWSLDNLFNGKKTPVWKWWLQSCKQADVEKGVPMLWLKKNSRGPTRPMPWLILLPVGFINKAKLPTPDVFWKRIDLIENNVEIGKVLPAVYIADRILKLSPRTMLKNYIKSKEEK